MTIEAIKTQIEPQLNNLFSNIIKLQQSQLMSENLLPTDFNWDYGANEKFDDIKKIQVLKAVQGVSSVPYEYKAKIVTPILNKLIDKEYTKNNKDVDKLVEAWKKESDEINIKFGEV
jgi:hypothetical protein